MFVTESFRALLKSRLNDSKEDEWTDAISRVRFVLNNISKAVVDARLPVASVEGRAMLRSANYRELVEPRRRGKRYGPCSFRVAAPFVWNNLPRHLRNDDISREQFARDLKTFWIFVCTGLFVRGAFENVFLKGAL